jgi:amino acid permease
MSVIGINAPSERSPSLLDVEEKYGITTGYFFTINCIVGAGILGLPWAYRFGGWMLGIIT